MLQIRENKLLVSVDYVFPEDIVLVLVQEVDNVLFFDSSDIEGEGAEIIIFGQRYLDLRAVIPMSVNVSEYPVRNLEHIVVALLELDLRSNDIPPKIQGIPLYLEFFFLLHLLRIDGLEREAVKIAQEWRNSEFKSHSVLFYVLRCHGQFDGADCILMLDLLFGLSFRLVFVNQLIVFSDGLKHAQSVSLPVFHK